MSKATQKVSQGYIDQAPETNCGTCRYCVPTMKPVERYIDPYSWSKGTHMVDTRVGQTCDIGAFKVKIKGLCRLYVRAGGTPDAV